MKKSEKLPKSFYIENRKKFHYQLDNFSAAVFFAGGAPHKMSDELYPFAPNRSFLYLTGLDSPKIIYFCVKTPGNIEEFLFIERSDEKKARWVGRTISANEARDLSGVDNIMFLDEFDGAVADALFVSNISNIYLDLENRFGFTTQPPLVYWERFMKSWPGMRLKDGGKIVRDMRAVKSEAELRQMREAINITKLALEHIIYSMRPGMYEYQLESFFDFALKYNGAGERAFDSIIGGGKNATILHYNANCDPVRDGDLVLMDFGATWNYYSADVTRTIPVNGKFTERQKELYNVVLEGQQKALQAVRPGVTIYELNDILIEYYKTALKKVGLIGKKVQGAALDAQIENFYWHKIGHALGLETHDCAPRRDVPLEPGMVITIEPGLYVEKEGIGIRIEDDILVTETGFFNLTESIPKTVDEIEKSFREASGGNEA